MILAQNLEKQQLMILTTNAISLTEYCCNSYSEGFMTEGSFKESTESSEDIHFF